MERIERQGRAFAQGMSQRYRDMRSNPMGDGGQGLHSARSTADDGQDGSRNTSRKRIALACSRCRKRKIKCSGDVGNGQGCTNCKNNTQEPCAFLRVQSTSTEFVAPNSMSVSWPYAHPGNTVNYVGQGRASDSSYGLPRGAGDLHSYATSPHQLPVRPASSISSYPNYYRQSYPSSLYMGQEEWQVARYNDLNQDFPMRPQEPNTIWHPINSQAANDAVSTSGVVEEGPLNSFSTLSNMAGTLPSSAQGSRTLPQPGQKIERGALPRLSNASSSLSSDISLPAPSYRSRPSWQSSHAGSLLGHTLAVDTDLSPQEVYDVSSENSCVSPINVEQRAIYPRASASAATCDEVPEQSRAATSTYGSGFSGDNFLGGRDPYGNGLYTYSVSGSGKSGSVSDAQSGVSQLMGNGEPYTRLPDQRPRTTLPSSNILGAEHQKASLPTPILPNHSGRRH